MMKRYVFGLVLLAAAGAFAPRMRSQAIATATGKSLAIGVAYQNIDPDYEWHRASGLQIYANYDTGRRLGLTAEINMQTAFSNVIFLEKSYLVGARGEYHKGRYMVYGKALIGGASSKNNSNVPTLINADMTFPAYALGGGLDMRLTHHITLRAIDYEDQHWLHYEPNSLTPHVFSGGLAYRFGAY